MLSTHGRASFAVLALVLLALANASAVHLAATHQAQEAERHAQAEREAALALLDLGRLQADLLARTAAAEAVREGGDLPRIQARFQELLGAAMDGAFPLRSPHAEVRVVAVNVSLLIESRVLQEPSVLPGASNRTILGRTIAVPDPGTARGVSAQRVPTDLRVHGDVALNLSGPAIEREAVVRIDGEVASPTPFLESRLRAFSWNVAGESSEFGRAVRYMLGTLLQFRILQGVAWGRYGVPGTTYAELLTWVDVEHAVNLALLLEEVRTFRSFDGAQAAGLDASLGRASGWTAGLLQQYARGGDVDPADLLLRLLGHGGETFSMRMLLAQALYAREDQSTLKWVDYLGLRGLLDLDLALLEGAEDLFDALLNWVLQTSAEAEAVKGFLASRLRDAGVDSIVADGASFDFPALAFVLGNVTVDIAAGQQAVSLPPRDLLDPTHNGFWAAYYPSLSSDLDRAHTSFEDFTKDAADHVAAGILAVTGVGDPVLALDPKDELSVFEELQAYVEQTFLPAVRAIQGDPSALLRLVERQRQEELNLTRRLLDHIRANYHEFAPWVETLDAVREGLADALFDDADGDPDFGGLSPEARAELRAQIESRLTSEGWVEAALNGTRARDSADFDWVLQVAASADLTGTGMLAHLVRILSGPAGLLLTSGESLLESVRAMVGGDHLLPPQVLVPTPEAPFEFLDAAGEVAAVRALTVDVGGYRRHSVAVDNPTSVSGGPRIALTTPVGFAADASPNVHFTRPWESFSRPFEQGWHLEVTGALPVVLTANGTSVRADAVAYGLRTPLTGFSGGALVGVEYQLSDTVWSDLRTAVSWVLDVLWPPIARALAPVVEAVRGLMRAVIEAITELAEAARETIARLTELIDQAVDLVRSLLDWAVQGIIDAIAATACPFAGPPHIVWTEGQGVRVQACLPGGTVLRLQTDVLGLTMGLDVVHLPTYAPSSGLLGHDLRVSFSGDSWGLLLDSAFDARHALQPRLFMGTLEWEATWAVDFAALVIEPGLTTGESLKLPPIPTPFGTLDLSVGYEITLNAEPEAFHLAERAFRAILKVYDGQGFPETSVEFESFLRAVVRELMEQVWTWFESEVEKVEEVALFLEGTVGALGNGGTVRLSVAVAGDAVRAALEWFARTLNAFLGNWGGLPAPAPFHELAADILTETFLRVQAGITLEPPGFLPAEIAQVWDESALAAVVEANLPAVAAALGEDWGPWEVNFGVVLEGIPLIADGATGDVWLLQGSAHPIA